MNNLNRCKIYILTRITLSLIPSLVTLKLPSGKDSRLVIWRPCRLGGSNPTADKIFGNVHLFRVPLRWTHSIQMKSSMTFIRGNRCLKERKIFLKMAAK